MKIFIGSSTKALSSARKLASSLRRKHEVILWSDIGAFQIGEFTYSNLEKHSKSVDAALFILGKDDQLTGDATSDTNKNRPWIPRDNVLIECGLFAGTLGIKRIALIAEKDTKIASDFSGLTIIKDDNPKMHMQINNWLEHISTLPPVIPKNVFLEKRQIVESTIRIEDRMGITDESYKYIKHIRFANLACNTVLTPSSIAAAHRANAILQEYCKLALEAGSVLEIIIQAPGCNAVVDAECKIRNERYAHWPTGSIYDSYLAYNLLIKIDDTFKKAYDEGRFIFHITEVGLPYGIFDIEYDDAHDSLSSVKIDTYCPELSHETERRSYVIWKHNNYGNYQYFRNKYFALSNSPLTVLVNDKKPVGHNEWIELAKKQGRIWDELINLQPIYKTISL